MVNVQMATRMLLLVATGELLGMTLWFSATAVTPALVDALQLGPALVPWITMSVQAGFVIGTLASALLSLSDAIDSRRLFGLGCAAGALANAAVPWAPDALSVIGLRVLTGIALAWVYPPGLKIASSWFRERRGTALGVVIGALTLGSAFPHLLAAAATQLAWPHIIWSASTLALVGGALVSALVRHGPHAPSTAPFDPRAVGRVLANRGTRLATIGYLGHMWELYAMWTWFPLFAGASLARSGAGSNAATAPLLTFLTIGIGAVGCVVAGRLADRLGKARIAEGAMLISGACAAAAGLAFVAPLGVFVAFAVVWGLSVVADSAQFSALVTEHSPPSYIGTALTLQICAGFLLTMVTIRLVPVAAAWVGWQWAFVVLVPGPVVGAASMRALSRRRS